MFDLIYIEDENIHFALRKKISNAWYQKKHREEKHYTKTELSHKLELLGIELDRFELYKIETAKTSVKDFELIGLCIVLDINFEELKKLVEDYS